MPTFEFRCPNNHVSTAWFTFSKIEDERDCPECGAHARRQIGAGSGVILKGAGFHRNDYPKQQQGGSA